jgi:succinate dehydrogenase / fumarate reductase cytochrome b subunit
MAEHDNNPEGVPKAGEGGPQAARLRDAIDAGKIGDKVALPGPAASPLGTDDEAAGRADAPPQVAAAIAGEVARPAVAGAARPRPRSPNIQIYRPQLTSVLSIGNRITGAFLSLGAVILVAWLVAGMMGPDAFATAQGAAASWPGQVVLVAFTFALFFHLCGGIRHLWWDTVHGFELRQIYASGWAVVAASVVLTASTRAIAAFVTG